MTAIGSDEGYLIQQGLADERRQALLAKSFNPHSIDLLNGKILKQEGNFLEVGCGCGDLLIKIAKQYEHITFVGVDNSEASLAVARLRSEEQGVSNIKWTLCDAKNLEQLHEEYPDGFNTIHTRFTLHHIPEIDKAVEQILKVSRTGTSLVFEEAAEECTIVSKPPTKAMEALWVLTRIQSIIQGSTLSGAERITDLMKGNVTCFYEDVRDVRQVTEEEKETFYESAKQCVALMQSKLKDVSVGMLFQGEKLTRLFHEVLYIQDKEEQNKWLEKHKDDSLIALAGYETPEAFAADMKAFVEEDDKVAMFKNFKFISGFVTWYKA